jgi:hypothetical protein
MNDKPTWLVVVIVGVCWQEQTNDARRRRGGCVPARMNRRRVYMARRRCDGCVLARKGQQRAYVARCCCSGCVLARKDDNEPTWLIVVVVGVCWRERTMMSLSGSSSSWWEDGCVLARKNKRRAYVACSRYGGKMGVCWQERMNDEPTWLVVVMVGRWVCAGKNGRTTSLRGLLSW